MNYNILEAKIVFNDSRLDKVYVLVDCTGASSRPLSDVRAICATRKPMSGYYYLQFDASINEELLQDVAAAGLTVDNRDEIFPKWKIKHLENRFES